MENDPTRPGTTKTWLIVLAWLIVGVPAAWGVAQTIRTSLTLFNSPPPASTQPAAH